jgi:predicted ATPase/class 3 adenylate cyclase
MAVCARCGHDNRTQARFCDSCGSPLEAPAPERRKLATMLFCDMSGSTAMGERVDAESVREMMFSYFHEMRGAIERHGGTVEKFIGDAVMAVFGVPTAHEDDALRACRAALEMQQRLGVLNEALERRYGSTIALRIGVNSGEVVAGDASVRQALVTGDAVNVAARLEQAASPGQILIGESTFQLVRDAVSAEPVQALILKGKSEPLAAYRLTAVDLAAAGRSRRLDTPMVGRERELAELAGKLARAKEGHALLATIVGEPGVGKSRLAAELVALAEGDFQVLSGRCLPYGEGITYWPIAEIVRQAAGIRDEHSREEALARLEALLPGDDANVVAQAVGLSAGEAGTEEIAAAVATFIGSLARERPMLLLVDDVHWAEQALLELLSGLPGRIVEASLVLVLLARPELLEEHAGWSATVRLQPLEQDDAATLVEQLLGATSLPSGLAEQIAGTAAGNPLFVEEVVGMLIDDGLLERHNGAWVADPALATFRIPATLRELLGARLDRLPADRRVVLERGAVEGQLFHRSAVAALSEPSEQAALRDHLDGLAEREFIKPARSEFADDAAYRVRHILIRDAAYEAIPKRLRAGLHERFAGWLTAKAGDRVTEYDEILGYHLEHAFRLREELGPLTAVDRTLALRAAEHLGAGGWRAFARRDAGAAVNLLLRAADLRPSQDSTRLELMEAGANLLLDAGQIDRAGSMFTTAFEEAAAAGNQPLAARIELYAVWTRLLLDPGFGTRAILEMTDRVEPVLQAAGDRQGLAKVHDARAYVFDMLRRAADVEREAELGIAQARLAGSRFHETELHWWLFWQLLRGPTPVEEAIRRCHELRMQIQDDLAAEAVFLESLGQLEAMRGRFDEARELIEASIENRDRLGLHVLTTKFSLPALGAIELLADEPKAAETALRRACDDAQDTGDRETAADTAGLLIEALLAQDRLDEAAALVPAAQLAETGDAVAPQVRSRSGRARILARKGDTARAERLGREAVVLTTETDDLNLRAAALVALADVLIAAGNHADARAAAEAALELFDRKGNVVATKRTRAMIEELDPSVDEFAPRSSSNQ